MHFIYHDPHYFVNCTLLWSLGSNNWIKMKINKRNIFKLQWTLISRKKNTKKKKSKSANALEWSMWDIFLHAMPLILNWVLSINISFSHRNKIGKLFHFITSVVHAYKHNKLLVTVLLGLFWLWKHTEKSPARKLVEYPEKIEWIQIILILIFFPSVCLAFLSKVIFETSLYDMEKLFLSLYQKFAEFSLKNHWGW